VVVRRKNQNTQPKHNTLCLDPDCGSAESTTKQDSWKVDGSGWEDDELGMSGKAVWVSGWTMDTARFSKVAARSTVGLPDRVPTVRESLVRSCMSLW
jgi:hypothetical protein